MQELVAASYQYSYIKEFRNFLGPSPPSTQELESGGGENVVRVTLVNPRFQLTLSKALDKMIEAKLQIDKFGFHVPDAAALTSESEETRLSDKLTILINDVTIAMKRLDYASYRGKVYKRDPRSKYTYSFKCEARSFMNTLATNEQFKSRLVQHMRKVIDLRSDPSCEIFQPLVIDYDLIEVKGSFCWSLEKRAFVEHAIDEGQIGKVSPRAFCPYDPLKAADPKYFRDILENSLLTPEIAIFCNDFVKLLDYRKKRDKDKVPCLVGDANSGKTSLFFPIQGLIHHGNIATVTKQRAFNKAMITPFTEVIFIDEADESCLDIADWKVLTQGGYTVHDVKYQTARAFINKCPMLITAQRKLDFGPLHQPAMDRRLRTYQFKNLPNPKKKAAEWLKRQAMDCLVWAAEQAKSIPVASIESEDRDNSDSDGSMQKDEEGILTENEKGALRSLSLDIAISKNLETGNAMDESISRDATGAEDANDLTSPDNLVLLRDSLGKSRRDSLRERQLHHMLHEQERIRAMQQEFARQRHQSRITALRDRGVSTQSAELLPMDPNSETPTPILRELDRCVAEERALEKEGLLKKCCEVFANHWVRETEKELPNCVKMLHTPLDDFTRASMEALLDLLQDKLKTHHKNLGKLGTEEALAERLRTCVKMGLFQERHAHLVKCGHEALPSAEEELGEPTQQEFGAEIIQEDDEADIFITPIPSWELSHTAFEKTRTLGEQGSPSCRGNRRRTGPLARRSEKRAKVCTNTILNYFSSQE